MQQTLTPHVYWAQRHEDIYLRVELIDAQNLDISVHDNVLQFRAQGHGARGQNDYEFSLPFLNAVKTEVLFTRWTILNNNRLFTRWTILNNNRLFTRWTILNKNILFTRLL
ncbi:unnamed protein product [Oncorhynchus mykiss]|uniref:CS domain-containing protein n=1 Tax=Oncorhynchus mykiss TaxID=8022 RepID=A0A061A2W3_ONCMY|nr:unnamed protein product [Oncorhynchus mykiss]